MKPILLVIDMQRWFFRTEERRVKLSELNKSINELITIFEEKNLPIMHVLTIHKKDKSTWPLGMIDNNNAVLIEGTSEPEELPEIKTSPQHQQLIKTRHSAFMRTNLEHILREQNIDTLILTGVFIHGCIGATSMDGYELDFRTIVSKDATFSHKPKLAEAYLESVTGEYDAKYLSNREIISLINLVD